jgi:hypothetical protein
MIPTAETLIVEVMKALKVETMAETAEEKVTTNKQQ